MTEVILVSMPWGESSLYALILAAGCLAAGAGYIFLTGKKGVSFPHAALFCGLSLFLGLALGRGVYCAVRFERLFFDAMGDFAGLQSFFDLSQGGISIVGVLAGCLIAGPVTARILGGKAAQYLDAAVYPGLFLFILERMIEPLAGRGYGVMVSGFFAAFPFAMETYIEEYALAVCWLEGVLGAVLFAALLFLQKKCVRPGQLFLSALTLLCASQIIPESLRHDDVLFIFIFARVTQIGYAVYLALCLLWAIASSRKAGLKNTRGIRDFLFLLLGIGVCVGAEFALDKTNLSHFLIYAVMLLTLAGMAAVNLRVIFSRGANK